MNGYNLRPLWDAMLDVYSEISCVCERHGLHYWLAYGSLLGAIRHSGFIPWDDDFDLMMPRNDYEEFIRIAKMELPPKLMVVSPSGARQQAFLHPFAKVKVDDAFKVDKIGRDANLLLPEGVFIDIFPLDGLPSSPFKMCAFQAVRALLRRISFDGRAQILDWWAKRIPYGSANYVGVANDPLRNYDKWRYPKSWFDETIWVPFDKMKVPVPFHCKDILTAMWGDYMVYPPIEDRHPGHQELR